MTRWVLRYPILGEAPGGDLDRIARDGDVRMVDRAGAGLALIEAPDHVLPRIRRLLPGWKIQPARELQLPE